MKEISGIFVISCSFSYFIELLLLVIISLSQHRGSRTKEVCSFFVEGYEWNTVVAIYSVPKHTFIHSSLPGKFSPFPQKIPNSTHVKSFLTWCPKIQLTIFTLKSLTKKHKQSNNRVNKNLQFLPVLIPLKGFDLDHLKLHVFAKKTDILLLNINTCVHFQK